MSSFLGKIKGFFIKAKSKKVLFLLFLFVFINFVLLLEPAKAQFIDFRGGFVGAITDILLGISSLFIKVTVWISQLFIVIASYNNFINSKAVILGWVLVRDVVNMFFVLILLVIAFGTVLGLEQYEWKKLLVKLVFAAVLVNFSRLICGVIIDAAQVFMMTFVNGFAATAGGNVINGLNLNKIYNLSVNANPKNITSDTDMLVTGVAAVFFGSISMFVLGAYLIVMLARVVSLWVLIVLSPIAFISSVLPATQKYASEWWKEFNNNVLVGPLLAFFFWLSFAIVGGGDSFQEVLPTDAAKKYETNALFGSTATGVAQAMDWGAMASFAIAIALLITGVKKTQELGVQGAGMLSSALSTAKKVGMYASGVAAVGWGAKKAIGAGAWTAKGVATYFPGVGINAWKSRVEEFKTGRRKSLVTSLEQGGLQGNLYNYFTKNTKAIKQQQAIQEQLDKQIDIKSGHPDNANLKDILEREKAKTELYERNKQAGGVGFKERAQAAVEGEMPGLRAQVLDAELRAQQTTDLMKGEENQEKARISKALIDDADFADRQRMLERIMEETKQYTDNVNSIKDRIAGQEQLGVAQDVQFGALNAETISEKLLAKEIKGEVTDRETLLELERIRDLLATQGGDYRRTLETRKELGLDKIEQERRVRSEKAETEAQYFEDVTRGNRPDRARKIRREEDEQKFKDLSDDNVKDRNQAELTSLATAQAAIIHSNTATADQKADARRLLNAVFTESAKDPATLQAVRDTALQTSGYTGATTSENATEMMASIYGALDRTTGTVDFLKLQAVENQIGTAGLKNYKTAAANASLKSGDVSFGASMSVGSDANGNSVYGFGSNVGTHDERGVARAAGIVRTADVTGNLDWYRQRVTGASAVDASHLFKRGRVGRTFDRTNLGGLARSLKTVTETNLSRNISPPLMADISNNLRGLSRFQIQTFLQPFAQEMTNRNAFLTMANSFMSQVPAANKLDNTALNTLYDSFHP